MRLKSLKLAGFKSFANSTTFTFPRGITAIVGPNGCGKSNVIDAIRWVLGETSAKQLRGGAMSDVIFAGTQDKAAKSVASVELTFEHTQDEQTGIRHQFNLYQELSVRRQVNLEGRSDYFINGTRCRRRDVVDVFLGTGLGARSYAVIEQGMIGRIVESNPMQLREFIEEAAGVSRYQARREETQKKLEKTQENLARLHDMQSELVRQQKSLARQATSAERHAALTLSIADVQQQLAIQQLYQAKHTQQQQRQAYNNSTATVSTLQTDYERIKAKLDKLAVHINQEQWLKDEAQSTYYQQQLELQQAEQQLQSVQAKLEQADQQLINLDTQRQQADAERISLQSRQAEQQAELADLQPQLDRLKEKRARYDADEPSLKRALYQAQDLQTQLQQSERTLLQQQALNTQAQQRLQGSQDKWSLREQNWQALWAQLPQSKNNTDSDSSADSGSDANSDKSPLAQIQTLKEYLQQNARQQDSVAERLSELQPQLHRVQQQLTVQQRELIEQEKSHAALAGEYDTLHKILHPKPAKAADSKMINNKAVVQDKIASAQHIAHLLKLPISTLREQIELSTQGQQYADLLDSLLALWLDSQVFIESELNDAAINSVDHLGNQSAANVAQTLTPFLMLSSSNRHQDSLDNQLNHSLWLPANQNNQQISFTDELADEISAKVLPLSELIAQPALALWQQCYLYLADDNSTKNSTADEITDELATILQALPSSALLLTTDGWIVHSLGMINVAKFSGAQKDARDDSQSNNQFLSQRLQQRTRLTQLEAQLDELEAHIDSQQQTVKRTQTSFDTLNISLEETRAQVERLTQDKYRYQQQLSDKQAANERLQMAQKQLQVDTQRLQADQLLLESERQELIEERQLLSREQQTIEQDIAALIPKLKVARVAYQQLQAERNELDRNRQLDDNAWQALQLTLQKVEMHLENTATSLTRIHAVYQQTLQSEQKLQASLAIHHKQLPRLQESLQVAQSKRDEQQTLLAARNSTLAALKQDYSQQEGELKQAHTNLQDQQMEMASLSTQLALSEAQLQERIKHTQESLDKYQQLDKANEASASQPVISVSSLLTDFITHERRVRPDKISELQAELASLEQQLSKVGPVNLAAISELNEINERLAPLAQQTDDIAASMATLTEAIAAIDETTKTLFMQTLDSVNTELSKLFAKVFGGGQASLTLNVDDLQQDTLKSEQWRAGLTLMAQPKGKRNSRLAVLSGGEKTLTALSLIFAIFKQHPAPFCVLDEVDAPLDDANVARFTSLITDLADEVQFIFISHNKLTMQIADELKGITMPSAGISMLVSVSLDEAARYIDS
ncbi:MAG: AAA family ATPase [Psychrobacter sp.]|nr:AAA family ATPase [Psychrobacter sp.]